MYRIHYASRLVVDARPTDDPSNIIRAANIKDTYARYENIEDAYRQAVNDMFHGKVVLGIEDEADDCKVVITAQKLTAAAEKMAKELGPNFKRSERQQFARELKLK